MQADLEDLVRPSHWELQDHPAVYCHAKIPAGSRPLYFLSSDLVKAAALSISLRSSTPVCGSIITHIIDAMLIGVEYQSPLLRQFPRRGPFFADTAFFFIPDSFFLCF